ncbi:MAG: hypothetical protein D6784_12925 [Chloroflexi bacterium]|nr:MAG: hypothetical protein D6784_12925 [Chloroflexota bacterium]
MKFLHHFRQTPQKPTAYSLVDIGRDTVKAVVVLAVPGQAAVQVVGYGLANTGGRDIAGGRLEADATYGPVNAALIQAEDSTEHFIGRKVVPDDVIFSLPGRATLGRLFTVRQTRAHPQKGVSAGEVRALHSRAERLVRRGLADQPADSRQWQPLAVSEAGLFLDRRLVVGPEGLLGEELCLSVFGAAGLAAALRALNVLANRLEVAVDNIITAPQALAVASPEEEAVLLDIGLGETEIYLIRSNGLVAADRIPFGGRFFTHALAQALDMPAEDAEGLKRAYAAGGLSAEETWAVDRLLAEARRRWYTALLDTLQAMSARVAAQNDIYDRPLPRKIFLTGGGSLLPGLDVLLRASTAPFDAAPDVAHLGPGVLPNIQDLTDGLDYTLFLPALCLTAGLPD